MSSKLSIRVSIRGYVPGEGEADTDALALADGLMDALGETEADTDELGDIDALTLADGDNDAEAEALGEILADGETDVD